MIRARCPTACRPRGGQTGHLEPRDRSPKILDDGAPWARRTAAGWVLAIRVQPGAARSGVVGEHGDALKVRVAAPADDGKANAELVRFLAEALGVPARHVEITRGHHSRSKAVVVTVE